MLGIAPGWKICNAGRNPRLVNSLSGEIIESHQEEILMLWQAVSGKHIPLGWCLRAMQSGLLVEGEQTNFNHQCEPDCRFKPLPKPTDQPS